MVRTNAQKLHWTCLGRRHAVVGFPVHVRTRTQKLELLLESKQAGAGQANMEVQNGLSVDQVIWIVVMELAVEHWMVLE
jgi:hypothetical protein